jgi:hypothetical protein
VSGIVSARRAGLAEARAAADGAAATGPERVGLLQRIQRFLRV